MHSKIFSRFAGTAALVALATAAAGPAGAARPFLSAPVRPALAGAHLNGAPHRAPSRVGSSNITIADRTVPRPDTTPCVVQLFAHQQFEDFNPKPFQFAPPAACPPPWAKVVLEVDLDVTAGVQFDRTATIGLGGSTIFFGTTSEPGSNYSPSWKTASDLTALSALFAKSQTGQVSIGNIVNQQYTGIIQGGARLQFYPPDKRYPAPRVADIVVPLADANGNPVTLNSSTDTVAASFAPPQNVERALLDVVAQSQHTDEFWYTCVPNDIAPQLNNCGNTAFRESEATIDGKPAGAAPIYPWIFTGGIDPFLWFPTPGVQTLNFVPYQIDVTPFAGTLDDGATHSVALSVFNADQYFSVEGNLLLFLDPGATALTGAVDTNTLSATVPETYHEYGNFSPNGSVQTSSVRTYTIAGHLVTPHGTIRTKVSQSMSFHQGDTIVNASTQFAQNIRQETLVAAQSVTSGAGKESGTVQTSYDYPFALDYNYVVGNSGATQTTTVHQTFIVATQSQTAGGTNFSSYEFNAVNPADTLNFDANGNFLGNTGNANSQVYRYHDSTGACYGREVKDAANVVTADHAVRC